MLPFDPLVTSALAAALLLFTLLALHRRRHAARRRPEPASTVAPEAPAEWSTEAVRVMSIHERRAHDMLGRSLPGMLVLAQVPLARFLRPPSAHGHARWQRDVGALNADLLICDAGSRVLAVIDIRSARETERSRDRHERLARALRTAGIRVYVWHEGEVPTSAEIRNGIGADLAASASRRKNPGTASRPMPLIPVPESAEFDAVEDAGFEPVPSDFFDVTDSESGQLSKA
ncbi:MAG: DUF2726 domain-containing protein [Burkholderiales bacterium]|nr:DUF2726 domain-containing protein [Burkholderiales bacterium]MDE2455149.1 DUF2726 domain-containing protein [Burkholderiales bacterium]